MSRVGKNPIQLGQAKLTKEGSLVKVEGPKGKLQMELPKGVQVEQKEGVAHVRIEGQDRRLLAFWGMSRALIQNMVTGVTQGYERRLEINGVGFRARVEGKNLVLALGFSHPIKYPLPEGVSAKVENKDTLIVLNGIDKQKVGNVAATIRRYYPPEPYKGKGVKYQDEVIRRKKGKRVA